MGFAIRGATVSDIHLLSAIHAASWKVAFRGTVPQQYLDELQEDHWVEAFTKWMGEGTVSAALAYEGDKAVGCAVFGPSQEEGKGDWGELKTIYLLPQSFGKGYGTMLMDVAMDSFRSAGLTRCYLWVLRENERARAFYRKLGFQSTEEEFHHDIMGKDIVNLRYIKTLSPAALKEGETV